MVELFSVYDASFIVNPSERLFATAMIIAFPHLQLFHECTVTAKSGKMLRVTRPDFQLINDQQQTLLFEVRVGNKKSFRKNRQRKTARLAGYGERYIVIAGTDLYQIKTSEENQVKEILLSIFVGRYNSKLFNFE